MVFFSVRAISVHMTCLSQGLCEIFFRKRVVFVKDAGIATDVEY